MRFFGICVFIIGLLSIALHFLNMNFIFLNWIDKWGTQTGWIIRGESHFLVPFFGLPGKRISTNIIISSSGHKGEENF
jgi:hypothetical protein